MKKLSLLLFAVLIAVGAQGAIVPSDPVADSWYDCGDESGFSKFYFTLPTTDVDGNMLDPENLSFSIFIDNDHGAELFTFPAEDYTYDLYTDITEVDYNLYSSAVDFHNYYVYFYRTNTEGYDPLYTKNIGIQAYYTVDGERGASNIAWLYERENVLVRGIVVDQNDNPLNAVTVSFTPVVEEPGEEGAPRRAETNPVVVYTDSEGYFEAIVPASQRYTVSLDYETASVETPLNIGDQDIDMETIELNVVVTGIDNLTANKQVASTTYFDMSGHRLSEPGDGVFVKSVRYTDGTVINTKVVK